MIEREIVPEPLRVTLARTATGGVILRQRGDTGDQLIMIPPEHLRHAALVIAGCVEQLVPSI